MALLLGLLLPRLIGTTTVPDTAYGMGDSDYPTTSMTLEDLEAPGTRFGVFNGSDWIAPIRERYPNGEIVQLNSLSDCYVALDAGKLDAAIGFLDAQPDLAKSHPGIAYIEKPFADLDFGFGTQKTAQGKALSDELSAYLRELKDSGEYELLRMKWEDPKRDGDVMNAYTFTGEKGVLRVATSGLWTPMTFSM